MQCSAAKVKCDRRSGGCTRCARRDISCRYTRAGNRLKGGSIRGPGGTSVRSLGSSPATHTPPARSTVDSDVSFSANDDSVGFQLSLPLDGPSPTSTFCNSITGHSVRTPGPRTLSCAPSGELEQLVFSDLDLLCPINADDISNRWLRSFMPDPEEKAKEYPANVTAFIYRMLKSYAGITVRGRGVPPFVHSSQITAQGARPPLSSCLALVRMCENPLPGSEFAAVDILQRQMAGVYESHGDYDDPMLLSGFQAYLIYALVLFFNLSSCGKSFLRQSMMNLQNLACSCSQRGLVSRAEQQRIRPRWEEWIVAESKRRTLFTMYLFDSVLLATDGLPTFLGTELQGLLAPAGMSIWRANTRREWEAAYNNHLTEWGGGGLRIDELWPIVAGLDEHCAQERRSRIAVA